MNVLDDECKGKGERARFEERNECVNGCEEKGEKPWCVGGEGRVRDMKK